MTAAEGIPVMTRTCALHVAVILALALSVSARAEQTRGPEPRRDRKGDDSRERGDTRDKSGKKAPSEKAERPGTPEARRGREVPAPVREPTAEPDRARSQRGRDGRDEPRDPTREEPTPAQKPQTREQPARSDRPSRQQPDVPRNTPRDTPRRTSPGARGEDGLSRERQRQLVTQHQQRLERQRQIAARQQRAWQQQTTQLQRQRRTAQVRLREQYLRRRVQVVISIGRRPAFDRDPYFSTPPAFRYLRGGRYYEINQYGAEVLRQAVQLGYEEGYQAGAADREDGWRASYREHYAYQDGDFGYDGYYVDRDDYVYYFREGFRRGYDDGYGDRYVYGRYDNGAYRMQDSVMLQVLILLPLR